MPHASAAYFAEVQPLSLPKEFLDGPDVVTVFEQVGHERMPDCLGFRGLGFTCSTDGFLQAPLIPWTLRLQPTDMLLSKYKRPGAYARRAYSVKRLRIKLFGGGTAIPSP